MKSPAGWLTCSRRRRLNQLVVVVAMVGEVGIFVQHNTACESVAPHELSQRHDLEVIRRIELLDMAGLE